MEEKKNNKVVWSVVFVFVTIILCYMFVVLYFFYISPYNIALKLGFWPLLSDNAMGEVYLDATVEIDFKEKDEEGLDLVDACVVGVNVRKDGYILAPYTELRDCQSDIVIKTNSGKMYAGNLLYSDANYNISVLKCENIDETGEIKLPYVNISSGNFVAGTSVMAISSPLYDRNIWTGSVADNTGFSVYSTVDVGGVDTVDFVLENCYSVSLPTSFTGGIIFDRHGSLLGLSYDETLDDGSFVIVPMDGVSLFLDDVVSAYKSEKQYQNTLIESFSGFDAIELNCFMDYGSKTDADGNKFFYFADGWREYTDAIISYRLMQNYSDEKTYYYYLFEDFKYGEQTIAKDNLVTALKYRGTRFDVTNKLDLNRALYGVKTGEEVEICYISLEVDAQEQSIVVVA